MRSILFSTLAIVVAASPLALQDDVLEARSAAPQGGPATVTVYTVYGGPPTTGLGGLIAPKSTAAPQPRPQWPGSPGPAPAPAPAAPRPDYGTWLKGGAPKATSAPAPQPPPFQPAPQPPPFQPAQPPPQVQPAPQSPQQWGQPKPKVPGPAGGLLGGLFSPKSTATPAPTPPAADSSALPWWYTSNTPPKNPQSPGTNPPPGPPQSNNAPWPAPAAPAPVAPAPSKSQGGWFGRASPAPLSNGAGWGQKPPTN